MTRTVVISIFLTLSWGITVLSQQSLRDKLKGKGIEIGLTLHQDSNTAREENKKLFTFSPSKKISTTSAVYRVSCNTNYCAFALKDGKVLVYDLKNSTTVINREFSYTPIYAVTLHPFKNVVSFGDKKGTLHMVDLDKKTDLYTQLEPRGSVSEVKFSPNGKFLAVAYLEKGDIYLHDIEGKTIEKIQAHGEGIYQISFSPDSRVLTSASRDKKISITPLGEKWPTQILSGHKSFVLALDFSKDNRFLASGGGDRQLIIWEKEGDEVKNTPYFKWVHSDWVNTVKFFNQYLITGAKDGKIRIFDYNNKKFLGTFQTADTVFSINVTPNNKYLVVGTNKDIIFYDLAYIMETISIGNY